MGVLLLLSLLLFVPLLFFLGRSECPAYQHNPLMCDGVFLALSSCLGADLRARNARHGGTYDKTYFRTMTNSGSEHIEMETMLNHEYEGHQKDYDDDF
jgi:hypothetical protein